MVPLSSHLQHQCCQIRNTLTFWFTSYFFKWGRYGLMLSSFSSRNLFVQTGSLTLQLQCVCPTYLTGVVLSGELGRVNVWTGDRTLSVDICCFPQVWLWRGEDEARTREHSRLTVPKQTAWRRPVSSIWLAVCVSLYGSCPGVLSYDSPCTKPMPWKC